MNLNRLIVFYVHQPTSGLKYSLKEKPREDQRSRSIQQIASTPVLLEMEMYHMDNAIIELNSIVSVSIMMADRLLT